MFYFLSKTLDLAASPLTWAIVLCVLALRPAVPAPRFGSRFLAFLAAAILYAFSIEPVANALARTTELPVVRTVRPDVTYDAVILLGGAVEDRISTTFGEPSFNDNVERVLTSFDLLRTGRAKNIIVSGLGDAPYVVRELTAWGIAKDRILLEEASRNTRENAVETARLAHERGWQQLVVVTSAFHMKRAAECFNAVDLRVDTLPTDYRSYDEDKFGVSWLPRANLLAESTGMLRELLGRRIYRLQGYAKP